MFSVFSVADVSVFSVADVSVFSVADVSVLSVAVSIPVIRGPGGGEGGGGSVSTPAARTSR